MSRARSFTDRWERTVLIRIPAIRTWIRSQSAHIRATIPARPVPIQNCRLVTHMFPDGGTTRSNSTGPPFHCAGVAGDGGLAAGTGLASCGCAGSGPEAGAPSRVAGSHRLIRFRCWPGTGVNRSAGVTGTFSSSAWCGRSELYSAT
jgi:hypothetical protein